MNLRALGLSSVVLLSCSGSPPNPVPVPVPEAELERLALQVPGEAVELMAGDSLLVQLLVVGDAAGTATIAAAQLPPFATLDGSRVRLAPSRAVAPGTYQVALTASAGGETATAAFDVEISRFNVNPEMTFQWWSDGDEDKYTCRIHTPLIGDRLYTAADCRFDGDPKVQFDFKDSDRDPVEVEFEFAANGVFTGVATHRLTLPASPGNDYVSGSLVITGLQNGTTYRVAMRACDVAGGCWQILRPERASLGDGWTDVGEIKKGCEAGATCGLPAGGGCSASSDCVSRSCDFSASQCCAVFRVGACL